MQVNHETDPLGQYAAVPAAPEGVGVEGGAGDRRPVGPTRHPRGQSYFFLNENVHVRYN